MRIHKHGGYVTKSQIENISRIFPSDKVKWNCCYDNDASGNGFDITTAYYLKGEECKAFARTNTGDTYKTIYLSFPDGNTQTFKEDAFSSGEYLKQHGIDNVISSNLHGTKIGMSFLSITKDLI